MTTTINGMSGGIMEFSQDLSTQEAPPPLPTGQYQAEIISASPKTSPTSGNTYANIMLRIPASAYPADYTEGDPDGMTLSYNRLLIGDTPQIRCRGRKFLEAAGGPLGRRLDLTDLIGLSVIVEVTHDTYEGETRAQIARIVPA
jgi:hypothetical protein